MIHDKHVKVDFYLCACLKRFPGGLVVQVWNCKAWEVKGKLNITWQNTVI